MASLQAESTPWFHYEWVLPNENEYISTYNPSERSSYENDYTLIHNTLGDPIIEQKITSYLQNSFVYAYLSSPLRYSYTDKYTLFLPIQCPIMDQAIQYITTKGFGYEDRLQRTNGVTIRDNLLQRHMCPYTILPEQIKDQQVRITTKKDFFTLTSGYVTDSNKILYYITLPDVSLYFLQTEL